MISTTMFWVYVFFFCYFVPLKGNPTFVYYNNSRFNQVYLPTKNNLTYPGEVFKYTTFISPFTRMKDLRETTDICKRAKDDLQSFEPTLWNSTLKNPCEIYFCQKEKVYNNSLLHYSAHRYCLQCLDTLAENFTLAKNCSHIDKTCLNHCSKDSDCIYYDKDLTLCYYKARNIFYAYDDQTHLYYSTFLYDASPILLLVIGFIIWIVSIFLIVIPNIYKVIYELKHTRGLSTLEKLRIIFSLPNQTFFLIFICPIVFFVTSSIDIIIKLISYDATYINANAFGVYINAAVTILAVLSLIINWFYVVRLMDFNTNHEDDQYRKYFLLHIIFLVVFFLLAIFLVISYALYRAVDKGKRGVWIYFTGVAVAFIFVVIFIVMIVLFILTILVLINLSKSQSSNENILDLALKLKVSVFIFTI